MRLTRFTRAAAAVVVGLLLLASPVGAQTVLTSTTLAAAMADTSGQAMSVTSATGFTALSTVAMIDKELVNVRVVNSTQISITRGIAGTRAATHVSGATVWVGPQVAFQPYVPGGQCTRTNLQYVPWIVAGDADASNNGQMYDCLGLTTAGQWARVDSPGLVVLGSTMASTAGTLGAFTGTVFTVSGTNAITGFTNPAGLAPGFRVGIVPSGVFTWTAAGNIAIAGTAVVNKLLEFVWNGSKWIPSYIA